MPGPISIAEIGNHDTSRASAGCMDELIVSQVNADMRNTVAHETEEYKVARKEFGHFDAIPDLTDGIGTVGERYPADMTENMSHKTAAIEAAFRTGTPSVIGNSFMAERVLEQILDGFGQSL